MTKHKLTRERPSSKPSHSHDGIVKKHGNEGGWGVVGEGVWGGYSRGRRAIDPSRAKATIFMPWVGGSGAAGTGEARLFVINRLGAKGSLFRPESGYGASTEAGRPLARATSSCGRSPQEAAVALTCVHRRAAQRADAQPARQARAGDFLRRHRGRRRPIDRLLVGFTFETKGRPTRGLMRPEPNSKGPRRDAGSARKQGVPLHARRQRADTR